jgi:hypothetical protein
MSAEVCKRRGRAGEALGASMEVWLIEPPDMSQV